MGCHHSYCQTGRHPWLIQRDSAQPAEGSTEHGVELAELRNDPGFLPESEGLVTVQSVHSRVALSLLLAIQIPPACSACTNACIAHARHLDSNAVDGPWD